MSRYRFTNKRRPEAFSIQDQAGYDNIVKKGWLGKYNVEVLENGPSMPITSNAFLPPEIQRLRADAGVKKEVSDQTKEATEQANQPVPNLTPPAIPAVPNPAPANNAGSQKAKANAAK